MAGSIQSSPACYFVFPLSHPLHLNCRSCQYRQRHRRNPLLPFLPLQQSALGVFRSGGRSQRGGRGAKAGREPVSVRPLNHNSAHLPHRWHIALVQPSQTDLFFWAQGDASLLSFQWSWSSGWTLSSERVWWRAATGRQWPRTQAIGAHTTLHFSCWVSYISRRRWALTQQQTSQSQTDAEAWFNKRTPVSSTGHPTVKAQHTLINLYLNACNVKIN